MSKPRLLVTRPEPYGRDLCAQLTAAGYPVVYLPTIAFAPPKDPSHTATALASIPLQDWLIFVSPQAVAASLAALNIWLTTPAAHHPALAAVGEGTRQALRKAGFSVSLCPTHHWGSEGLLALPAMQTVQQQRILVICGEDGRDNITPILKQRGAMANTCYVYRRILPTIPPELTTDWLQKKQIDVLICTAYEGVRNLKEMLGAAAWPHLQTIPLIVVSERIKKLAADSGFQTIWAAENASERALIHTLSHYWTKESL